jgi:hypothetical protein
MRRQLLSVAGALLWAGALPAQERPDSAEIARLKEQVEAITRELERLQLGDEVVTRADTAMLGFGPAASKVYRSGEGVSLGGYGEFLLDHFAATNQSGADATARSQLDALRGVVYVGYKFNDRILFNSEIEVEHGSTGQGGEVSLEFAYLDFRITRHLGARAGLLLLPMGWLNEMHEPTTYLSARRPDTEQRILPSTWRENGFGVFGSAGPVSYRAYLVTGSDAIGGGPSEASGYSASGLRGGRQKGARALAESWAGVTRVDVMPMPGLLAGASAYFGNAGQGADDPLAGDALIDAETFIGELHAEYRGGGLWLRALGTIASVNDVPAINAARGLTGTASVGERLWGWYVEGGYNVLRRARTTQELYPYARYESLNTQHRVPDGFTANPANDLTILSIGAAWKPIGQVVLKGDYQIRSNAAETGVNQVSVQLGYIF